MTNRQQRKMITNCVNCSAPLNGDVCEYCGTRYDRDVYLSVGGVRIPCYITRWSEDHIGGGTGRDFEGRIMRRPTTRIRTFEVVEI